MKCAKCGSEIYLDEDHDALYCLKCNCYLECLCSDPKCWYCVNRPKHPPKEKK